MSETRDIPVHPDDIWALAQVSPEERQKFYRYMAELETRHAALNFPYGQGSLYETTGALCWMKHFNDDRRPARALAKELTAD